MKSFQKLADSVVFDTKSSNVKVISKDESLLQIGKGRSAYVFKVKSTPMVIKVFFPEYAKIAKEESTIYKILKQNTHYPAFYESGPNYLVIDFIDGHTLFDCLNKGIVITDDIIREVERTLNDAKKLGLNPSDVHLRNILLTKENEVKLIDVARFRQSKNCSQWNDLKSAFYKYYCKKLFPKRIPAFVLNWIAMLYKRNLIPASIS